MCLSSVYDKTADTEHLLIRNVQLIRVEGDEIVCTDIMEEDTRIRGRLISANLVEGRVIVDKAS
jgi:predicted RNA-binding protein